MWGVLVTDDYLNARYGYFTEKNQFTILLILSRFSKKIAYKIVCVCGFFFFKMC